MDEHLDLPPQTTSSDSTAPVRVVSLGSLQTDLLRDGVNDSFILVNDIGLHERPCVELDKECASRINSKLSFSYQGKLYGKIEITGERPTVVLKDESESWRAFKSELKFIASHLCHWHSHPSIIKYHGLALLKEEECGCVPYLLSERVYWNLLSLLEDNDIKLSQRNKVSIIHDIASGLSFLHSHKPRAIVHAALVPSSVLLDKRGNTKLTNFFHTGYVGDSFTIVSQTHKPPKYNGEIKLQTSLDMSSLGYIIKAIDTHHKNREQIQGWRNILEDLYVLYDCEDGPPQDLTAGEVCRKLADYLENTHQNRQGHSTQQEAQQPAGEQKLSVSLN